MSIVISFSIIIIVISTDSIISILYDYSFIIWIKHYFNLITTNDVGPEIVNIYVWLYDLFHFFLTLGRCFLICGNDPCKPHIPHSLVCLKLTYEFERRMRYCLMKGNNQPTNICFMAQKKFHLHLHFCESLDPYKFWKTSFYCRSLSINYAQPHRAPTLLGAMFKCG